MTLRLIALLALIALALSGCHRGYKPGPNPVEIDAAEYDRVFEASVLVLRDEGFRVDRRDHRFGRVTTRPLASPTVFEPWVGHNTTAGQTAQSTLDYLRRTVTVTLEPVTPEESAEPSALTASVQPADDDEPREATSADAYRLRVEVLLENEQVPVRRLNGSVTGSRFSSLRAAPSEWAERNIAASYWQPIGRDAYLEDRLARAILERSLTLSE